MDGAARGSGTTPASVREQPGGHIRQGATKGGESAREGRTRSIMPIAKSLRMRDRDHLKFISAQPCLICARSPSDAHHVKFAQGSALGRKVSDEFTVPLCRTHHRELHLRGDERTWWQQFNVDPMHTASALWAQTHPGLLKSELSQDGIASASVGNGAQYHGTKPINAVEIP